MQTCISRRLEAAARIQSSARLQALALAHLEGDVEAFISDWCWTYDPRNAAPGSSAPASVPFLPFDVQLDLIAFLEERWRKQEDGLVEKSRDMGFTWIMAAWMSHKWRFVPGFAGRFGSRKAGLVDELGNMDAILPKVRFILDTLPPWLKPRDLNTGAPWSKEDKAHSKRMLIRNPENQATIGGDGGEEIGRGGRAAVYVVDEHAYLPNADAAEAALSRTTDMRIYGSSAKGMGNLFYRKRASGDVPVFTMKWTDDPRRSEEWYAKQVHRFRSTPWIVPQELDIDYSAGVEGVAIPGAWVKAAQRWTCPDEVRERFDPVASLDVADGGGDANVILYMQGPKVWTPDKWYEGTSLQTGLRARQRVERWRSPEDAAVESLVYDANGVGAAVAGYFNALELGADQLPAELAASADVFSTPPAWEPLAYKGGSSPSSDYWESVEKSSSELFLNLRAESWWKLRQRLEKTYELVHGIADHPPEECLDLPADGHTLAMQISTPRYHLRLDDKIVIEAKKDMKKRGASSPDEADALTMALAVDLIRSAPLIGRL